MEIPAEYRTTTDQNGYATAGRTEQIGGLGYYCTCPDYQKRQLANPVSPYKADRVSSDWTASSRGAPRQCKHILSAMLFAGVTPVFVDQNSGLNIPFPKDLPS